MRLIIVFALTAFATNSLIAQPIPEASQYGSTGPEKIIGTQCNPGVQDDCPGWKVVYRTESSQGVETIDGDQFDQTAQTAANQKTQQQATADMKEAKAFIKLTHPFTGPQPRGRTHRVKIFDSPPIGKSEVKCHLHEVQRVQSTRSGDIIHHVGNVKWWVWGKIPDHILNPVPGDANNDGRLDNVDVSALLIAYTNPVMYAIMYPNVDPEARLNMNADSNGFDNLDIAPWINELLYGNTYGG